MTTSLGNLYESIDGTSESAPLVAGALARIMSKGGTITDLESSMSAISSAVGKGAINLEKTCINLAAKYENQNEKQHYAPNDDELSKDLKTEFKNQSTTSFSIDKIIF
jgi:Subtilase family